MHIVRILLRCHAELKKMVPGLFHTFSVEQNARAFPFLGRRPGGGQAGGGLLDVLRGAERSEVTPGGIPISRA